MFVCQRVGDVMGPGPGVDSGGRGGGGLGRNTVPIKVVLVNSPFESAQRQMRLGAGKEKYRGMALRSSPPWSLLRRV